MLSSLAHAAQATANDPKWTDIVGAIGTLVGLALTILAVSIAGWAARTSGKIGKASVLSSSVQMMAQYRQDFDSERTRQCRRDIGAAILAASELDEGTLHDVMGIMESLAWAVRFKAIPEELAWSTMGDWVLSYWVQFQPDIEQFKASVPGSYEDLTWLVPRLNDLSKKRGLPDPETWFRAGLAGFWQQEATLRS